LTSQYIPTSQWSDFIGIFAADGEFPVSHQFISVEFYPSLHQTQLLAWQITRKNLPFRDADGCLEFCIFGMDMRQVVGSDTNG
jgi:hypothetical protein